MRLDGTSLVWRLHSCRAGDTLWALGEAVSDSIDDAKKLAAELSAVARSDRGMAESSSAGVAAVVVASSPSSGVRVSQLLPDGRRVLVHRLIRTHGVRVVEATVVGSVLDEDAVSFFLGSVVHEQ